MLPVLQVGSQQGPEGLRQASRGCRGYGAAPALNPEAHTHIGSRADMHAGSCLFEPQLEGRGFPAPGQEAPAKAWHFQGFLQNNVRVTGAPLLTFSPLWVWSASSFPSWRNCEEKRIEENKRKKGAATPRARQPACTPLGERQLSRGPEGSPVIANSAKEFISKKGSSRDHISKVISRSHPTKPETHGWRETGTVPKNNRPF